MSLKRHGRAHSRFALLGLAGCVLIAWSLLADWIVGQPNGFGRLQAVTLIAGLLAIFIAVRRIFRGGRPLRVVQTPDNGTRAGRQLGMKIALAAIATCLGFAACEVIVRKIRPQHTYTQLLRMTGAFYVEGGFIPHTLRKSFTTHAPSMQFPEREVTYRTSSLGLRSPEITIEKPFGVYRILILGDSYTFGVYVEDHQTYPFFLQQNLEKDRPVQVINAGFADGSSPDEHYAWLLNKGLAFDPDVVIYGFFVGNDVDGYDMLERSMHWKDLDGRGLPRTVVDPSHFVDPLGRRRSRVKDEATVGTEFIYGVPGLRESHFALAACISIEQMGRRIFGRFRRPSAGKPNRAGFDFSTLMPFVFQASNTVYMNQQEDLFKKIVVGLNEATRAADANFVVLMIPINVQVDPSLTVWGNGQVKPKRDYFSEITPWLSTNSIATLNILESMRAQPGEYFPANGEVHCTADGNAFIANRLADFLRERFQPDECKLRSKQ